MYNTILPLEMLLFLVQSYDLIIAITTIISILSQAQRFSAADYIRALEYRTDRSNSSSRGDGQQVLSVRYSARCRIGRGGRLVVDRFPVSFI